MLLENTGLSLLAQRYISVYKLAQKLTTCDLQPRLSEFLSVLSQTSASFSSKILATTPQFLAIVP